MCEKYQGEEQLERLISVVVPIYNTEIYLEKCIDSILLQMYKNIEVILIDDGSTDNCGHIVDVYRNKDPRVIVIHTKNEGVSAARNIGISVATGEYILFVDSDDMLKKEAIEVVVNKLANNSLLLFGYETIDMKYEITSNRPALNFNYIWNKVFNRKVILENNIHFPAEMSWGEDTIFLATYLNYVDEIHCINESLYQHRVNAGSSQLSSKYIKNLDSLVDYVAAKFQNLKNNKPQIYLKVEEALYFNTICIQSIYNMYHIDSKLRFSERRYKLKCFSKNEIYLGIQNEHPNSLTKNIIVKHFPKGHFLIMDCELMIIKFIKTFLRYINF